jgi:hypothetical protein
VFERMVNRLLTTYFKKNEAEQKKLLDTILILCENNSVALWTTQKKGRKQ